MPFLSTDHPLAPERRQSGCADRPRRRVRSCLPEPTSAAHCGWIFEGYTRGVNLTPTLSGPSSCWKWLAVAPRNVFAIFFRAATRSKPDAAFAERAISILEKDSRQAGTLLERSSAWRTSGVANDLFNSSSWRSANAQFHHWRTVRHPRVGQWQRWFADRFSRHIRHHRWDRGSRAGDRLRGRYRNCDSQDAVAYLHPSRVDLALTSQVLFADRQARFTTHRYDVPEI